MSSNDLKGGRMRRALLALLLAVGCASNPEGANPTVPASPTTKKLAASPVIAEPPRSSGAAADDNDLPPLPRLGPVAGETPDDLFRRGRLAEALLLLEKARRADPERLETYYNEGLLLLEYAPLFEGQEATKALMRARRLLQVFVERAGDSPLYADAVRVAKARLNDIDAATICDFGSEAERKAKDAEEKQRAAEEEAGGP
jgi:hypothetical protein